MRPSYKGFVIAALLVCGSSYAQTQSGKGPTGSTYVQTGAGKWLTPPPVDHYWHVLAWDEVSKDQHIVTYEDRAGNVVFCNEILTEAQLEGYARGKAYLPAVSCVHIPAEHPFVGHKAEGGHSNAAKH